MKRGAKDPITPFIKTLIWLVLWKESKPLTVAYKYPTQSLDLQILPVSSLLWTHRLFFCSKQKARIAQPQGLSIHYRAQSFLIGC